MGLGGKGRELDCPRRKPGVKLGWQWLGGFLVQRRRNAQQRLDCSCMLGKACEAGLDAFAILDHRQCCIKNLGTALEHSALALRNQSNYRPSIRPAARVTP